MTNIIISGLTAAGKTTHAKILAEVLGFDYFSASTVLKEISNVKGDLWLNEWDTVRENGDLDRELDQVVLEKFATSDHTVFDAWALPWTAVTPAIRIWLESDIESRAKKVIVSRLRINEHMEFNTAIKIALDKDNTTRILFSNLYGFDLFNDKNVFDIILSNTELINNPTIQDSDTGISLFSPILQYIVETKINKSSNIRLNKFQESLIVKF